MNLIRRIYLGVVVIWILTFWRCWMWQEELLEFHLKSIQDIELKRTTNPYTRDSAKNRQDPRILREMRPILPAIHREKDTRFSQLCLRQDLQDSAYQILSSTLTTQMINRRMSSGLTNTVGKTLEYEEEKIQRHKSW